ncbi:MAG TPA: phenylalanine--tRNA ligase subunit beta, partial [Steroidobacteraceae bacterium]|nr:phenylalanine--tRNA ligase subunit beta [Steroidobacteraceae bacterium]
MKITQHWLEEFTPIGASAAELAAQLTVAGLEVESLEPAAPPFSGVVVGEVLKCARHPNAERLSVCEVTTDGADRLQIVCGAPNARAGLKVAVAKVGARLPGEVLIKGAKLRGVESQGMLCSARELGIGTEHDGILELSADLALGGDLRAALDLDDTVLAVNATPNRGDCMSVFGIARDHAASRRRRHLRYTTAAVPAAHDAAVAVTLAAPDACPVFAGRVIRGIRIGAHSPFWLRERLRRVGINPISPVVDVTNYVMAEIGQPMHAYDAARLAGPITVRFAADGERVVLLNDVEYPLQEDFLVIADADGPVGLAGIMGGRRSAIAADTMDVFLEAAHFAPQAVAGRARRLGLFTDAAQRFERGVDAELPRRAIERATALLLEVCGGAPGPVQETRAHTFSSARPRVRLRRRRLERLLGATVPDQEVHEILAAIGDRVEEIGEGWEVTVPSQRFDLAIEADLVEEVARLRGFDRIAEQHAVMPQIAGAATEARVAPERALGAMIDRGYHEAITYSFVDPTIQRALFPDTAALALANPISAELAEMRLSLWPGLLQALRENARRQQSRVRLIELGRKFLPEATGLREVETLAGVASGTRWPEQWGSRREPVDFYDVRADLDAVFALTADAASIRYQPADLACLRPGRTARVWRGARAVGWLGELHPRLAKQFDLSSATWLFELEIEECLFSNSIKYKHFSIYPSVRRDLAVVVDEKVSLAELRENVTVSAAGLLADLLVFDVYRGSGIDSGR